MSTARDSEAVEAIRSALAELNESASPATVKNAIATAIRHLSALAMTHRSHGAQIAAVANDLRMLQASEAAWHQLHGGGKGFSDGFFRSAKVLAEEIGRVLQSAVGA